MIPDEAVEAAARAIYGMSRSVYDPDGEFSDEWATWEQASERKKAQDHKEARAALEAAAPYLMAAAWDEGSEAGYLERCAEDNPSVNTLANPYRPTNE